MSQIRSNLPCTQWLSSSWARLRARARVRPPPAIGRSIPHLTSLLRRAFSLSPCPPPRASVHGGRLPNPRLTAGRRGVVPGGAANRTHNLRGPLPRLLPPRRLIPALFCIVTRALGASSIPAPWQMPSSRPTSSSTSPTTKLCAASSDSSTSTRSPSTGPRLFRGEMIPTSATWMMTLARTPCSH